MYEELARENVRVHRQSPAPARIGAEAYTQGDDIYLGPGYDRHLSHELGHVAQQRQNRVRPTGKIGGQTVNESPALEHEADSLGSRIESGSLALPQTPAPQTAPVQAKKRKPAVQPKEENPAAQPIIPHSELLSDEDKGNLYKWGARTGGGSDAIKKMTDAYMGNSQRFLMNLVEKFSKDERWEQMKSDEKKTIEGVGAGDLNYSSNSLSLAGDTFDAMIGMLDDEGVQEFIKGVAANTGGEAYLNNKKATGTDLGYFFLSNLVTRGFGLNSGVMAQHTAEVNALNQNQKPAKPNSRANRKHNVKASKLYEKYQPLLDGSKEIAAIQGKIDIVRNEIAKDPEKFQDFVPLLEKYDNYRTKLLGIALPSIRDENQQHLLPEHQAISRPAVTATAAAAPEAATEPVKEAAPERERGMAHGPLTPKQQALLDKWSDFSWAHGETAAEPQKKKKKWWQKLLRR